jgi:hypothetical protein
MNIKRKEAALRVYSPLLSEKSIEEIAELIKADEKGYKEGEVAEIVAALEAGPDEAETEKAKETEADYYEEWKCEVINKKVDKLKITRPKVKITEAEAEILNRGILTGGNTIANMYFAPGADLPAGEE